MYNVTKLDNGIQIVTETMPFVRSISLGIWVKVGSQNEIPNLNGISHFIEHMLFKGTSKRSAKDIADQMDAIGGQMNAFTTKQMTCYHTRILDENFDKALEIMADMFLNSTFDENEMAKEKKVIIEEINMYEDTPEELVFEIMNEKVWKGSSISYPILGSIQNVQNFTRDHLLAYYQNNYIPENIVITVAGNFETSKMIYKLKQYFDSMPTKNCFRLPFNAKYKKGIVCKEKNIEQLHLCLGFPGIKISFEESYAVALLNTILGGGMSSRLYQKIREENGLAYSLFSYNYAYESVGLFTIYAAVNPEQAEKCVQVILDEIKNLQFDPITNEQLSKTKEQLKSTYLMSLENSANRMNSLGKSIISYDKALTPEQIIRQIDQVSIDQIYRLINYIFRFDLLSLSAVGKGNYDFERIIRDAQ